MGSLCSKEFEAFGENELRKGRFLLARMGSVVNEPLIHISVKDSDVTARVNKGAN